MNLALTELRIVLPDLLKNFNFTLVDETMRDEKIALETVLSLRPLNMMPVYVSKRQ